MPGTLETERPWVRAGTGFGATWGILVLNVAIYRIERERIQEWAKQTLRNAK